MSEYLPIGENGGVLTFMPHYNGRTATFDIYGRTSCVGSASTLPPEWEPAPQPFTRVCSNVTRDDAQRIVTVLQSWLDSPAHSSFVGHQKESA